MTIGVGVAGPSDREFWYKVLHKYFRGVRFDVRNMKSRGKLIQAAPRLLDAFRDLYYKAAFILVDRDATPCVRAVLEEFNASIQQEARRLVAQRYLFVCVAIRELEAWFLADAAAINAVLPGSNYNAPKETGEVNAEARLANLWRAQYGQVAFNKIDFAKRIAPKFKPIEASNHSKSFTYFWKRMTSKARS